MYSVMAIFTSSVMWGLFEYTESGAQRHFDHPVQGLRLPEDDAGALKIVGVLSIYKILHMLCIYWSG
jgi:hypothetical protein